MASALIIEQLPFLKLLAGSHITTKQREFLLDTITWRQLAALSEITHNLLIGNIPIAEGQKEVLKRHRLALRILAKTDAVSGMPPNNCHYVSLPVLTVGGSIPLSSMS
jgi:hypothetical protein